MGMGYVGITTALLFAELGWKVTGLDPDHNKIKSLKQGILPFHEPGVDDLLSRHVNLDNLTFSADPQHSIINNQIIFICVGTPSQYDGSANLSYIKQAATWIGTYMEQESCIVTKSTVPIGTNKRIVQWIKVAQVNSIPYDVVSNPEFLREGSALRDSLEPDRIVIGSNSEHSVNLVSSLYVKLNRPIIVTKPETAEMIKYASNAFLATKISFINELARLCDLVEINITDVAKAMGMDHRIGPHFLNAGIGYGGSCFPKDVNALLYTANDYASPLSLLKKVAEINNTQSLFFLERLEQQLSGFENKTIAVLGIAFKPNTDDIRESPSLKIIAHLLRKQATVQAHDPVARLPGDLSSDRLIQCSTMEDALEQADAVILCTEWDEYLNANWEKFRANMRDKYFLDGRNALDRELLTNIGFHYLSISNY